MNNEELSGWTKLLLKYAPRLALRRLTRKMGVPPETVEGFHDAFSKTRRVDIFPTQAGFRGFIIVLDSRISLHFYQDGDHFVYDGYEAGPYEKGDVTVFDDLKDPVSPYR